MEISAKDIDTTLGKNHILKGISMRARTGETLGIIGPNGSGKSTFLKCIYRVLRPNAGMVYLDQKELYHCSVKESARSVAVVAQHNFYNFEFTVEEVVRMGRSPYKKAMERDNEEDYRIVKESLETVDMLDFSDRIFSTLSGGEQQRVILARALAQRTPCLILDEPTNHLDIKYQLDLMNLIRKLDRTVIITLHDLNIAAKYCDRLYAMKDGKIVGEGTCEELLTPEFIKKVFEVDAEVIRLSDGSKHIIYK